jgi:hypothetical protein
MDFVRFYLECLKFACKPAMSWAQNIQWLIALGVALLGHFGLEFIPSYQHQIDALGGAKWPIVLSACLVVGRLILSPYLVHKQILGAHGIADGPRHEQATRILNGLAPFVRIGNELQERIGHTINVVQFDIEEVTKEAEMWSSSTKDFLRAKLGEFAVVDFETGAFNIITMGLSAEAERAIPLRRFIGMRNSGLRKIASDLKNW